MEPLRKYGPVLVPLKGLICMSASTAYRNLLRLLRNLPASIDENVMRARLRSAFRKRKYSLEDADTLQQALTELVSYRRRDWAHPFVALSSGLRIAILCIDSCQSGYGNSLFRDQTEAAILHTCRKVLQTSRTAK